MFKKLTETERVYDDAIIKLAFVCRNRALDKTHTHCEKLSKHECTNRKNRAYRKKMKGRP